MGEQWGQQIGKGLQEVAKRHNVLTELKKRDDYNADYLRLRNAHKKVCTKKECNFCKGDGRRLLPTFEQLLHSGSRRLAALAAPCWGVVIWCLKLGRSYSSRTPRRLLH